MPLAWKVLTHDRRSPIQGGLPLFAADAELPVKLPEVFLNTSSDICGAGWNACLNLFDALRIGGLWPGGWTSTVWLVELGDDAVERGDKLRSSQCLILRAASDTSVAVGVHEMSEPFGEHAGVMAEAQLAWRAAFTRPHCDAAAVEAGLRVALDTRGLGDWELRRYSAAWEVRGARGAWGVHDIDEAWATDATWGANSTWGAAATDGAWSVRETWGCWGAFDAWRALVWQYAALCGWRGDVDPLKYTTGIIGAYTAGLEYAEPVAPGVLGWAMKEER
jgi:hypothetical protein